LAAGEGAEPDAVHAAGHDGRDAPRAFVPNRSLLADGHVAAMLPHVFLTAVSHAPVVRSTPGQRVGYGVPAASKPSRPDLPPTEGTTAAHRCAEEPYSPSQP